MPLHKNTPKRWYVDGGIYFVTTVTEERFPYFKDDVLCEMLIEDIKICKELHGFRLFAFNILYEHLHFVVQPRDGSNISTIMHSLKRGFARKANQMIVGNDYIFTYPEKVVGEGWVKIRSSPTGCEQLVEGKVDIPPFKWQRGFFEHVIRDEKDFVNHLRYTENNHKKHWKDGYKEDHPYSSLFNKDMIDT